MSCSACSARVEKVVGALDGVKSASVSLLTNSMLVEYDSPLTPKDICKAVAEAGYKAALASDKSEKKDKIDRFLIHPLLHSLEIFAYVLVVNLIFGIIVNKVGEENLITFLTSNKYLAPLLAVIVGAIPNCVSSVVISELYIMGGLGFGATLGGLCMNAGVAFVYLFKDVKHTKRNLAVFGAMFAISLVIGYIFSLAFSFSNLNF